MTRRNRNNLIKFIICALATTGLLWVMSVPDWQVYHVIILVVCVGVWIWYLWQTTLLQYIPF